MPIECVIREGLSSPARFDLLAAVQPPAARRTTRPLDAFTLRCHVRSRYAWRSKSRGGR